MAESHTWQARLWVGNNEGLYSMARAIVDRTDDHDEQASEIRDMIEYVLLGDDGNVAGTLAGDIITSWMQAVDWDAVAEAQRDE